MLNKTRTRVVSIPVARPLSCEPGEWKALLKELWVQSTSLHNWVLTEWIKAEKPRQPEDEKIGPIPEIFKFKDMHRIYNYRPWWNKASNSASCILQAVRKRWLKDRHAVVWQRRQSPPVYRYPAPYRVHSRSWEATFDENGQAHVWASFPGGRIELLLRAGPEYRRQLVALREIVEGRAKKCEMMIDRHRKTGQVICRIVGGFPAADAAVGSGVLKVQTCTDRFWRAETPTGQEWLLNADHIRRWVVSHLEYLQRISDDTKFEKRWPRKMRRHINESREVRCQKQNYRLGTWIQQACAQVVGFALRRKCAGIEYDDTLQSFFPKFPWHQLKERLKVKCQDNGLEFIYVGNSAAPVEELV